jgi:membrane protease YdiL (CAAX protease family)
MAEQLEAKAARRGPRLAVELLALYLGVPLAIALAAPADWLWPVLFGMTAVALALLAVTPGFAWAELARGWRRIDWRLVGGVAAMTALACGLLVWWLVPGRFLALPRNSTGLWLMILALYPLLSALPQELIFRALFFRRYGGLFHDPRLGVAASTGSFALAHLMFWNWVAVALTLAGGLLFARAYLERGFALAVLLHAVCGWIVFTSGLGGFFYHGAVGP